MANLTDHVNQLHQILSNAGVTGLLDLPEIAVVGDQSSGKSSVLQSIVSKEILPKGEQIVTRCPIRICMHYISSGDSYATFPHLGDNVFNINQVSKLIEERNLQLAGNSVSKTEIVVNLFGQELTNLTLVDLPGIIRVRRDDQPKDIVESVEELVMERIKNDRVLILAVSAANNDLATSGGIEKAKIADPEGKRTIGVITKMDIASNPQNFVDTKKLNISANLGFVGVKCRTQDEINGGVTIEEQLNREKDFFKTNKHFKAVSSRFGVEALKNKIDNEFSRHISEILPKIKEEVKRRLELVNAKLLNFGEAPPEITDHMLHSHGFIDNCFITIDKMLVGTMLNFDSDVKSHGFIFREEIIAFHTKMRGYKDILVYPTQKVNSFIKCSGGLEGLWTISEHLVKNILEQNLNQLKKDFLEFLTKINSCFNSFLEELSKLCFPSYPNMRALFFKKFAEVRKRTIKVTEERINFLVFMEVDCMDPDVIAEDQYNKPSDGYIKSIISQIFLESKKNLENSVIKSVKYFFIKATVREAKAELHKHIGSETNLKFLFEENSIISAKRDKNLNKKAVYEDLGDCLTQMSEIFFRESIK